MRKWFKRVLVGLLVTAVVFGTGIAAGLWTAELRADRNSLLSRVERKAAAYFRSAVSTGELSGSQLRTNRMTLQKDVLNVPLSVSAGGGGIAAAPDGGLFLIDRLGSIFHIENAETTKLDIVPPDNNLDDLIDRQKAGEFGSAGLHTRGFRYNDILVVDAGDALDMLVSYSDWVPDRACYRNTLARLTLSDAESMETWRAGPDDWQIVKSTEPCLPARTRGDVAKGIEAGGRLLQISDSEILWSQGVYELDDWYDVPPDEAYAQSDASDYGRVFGINLDTGEIRTLAKGLRNPQGLTQSKDGRIWISDHGMRGGDELNLVEPGEGVYNFGWPVVSYGTHSNGSPVSKSGRHEGHAGYDLPVVSFVPSIAPGSALAIENFHPVWDGDVLVGGFRGTLERVHVVDGRAIVVEPIPIEVRPRDMAMTTDGQIVVWTDNLQLIYLSPSEKPEPLDVLMARLETVADADRRETARELVQSCSNCHSFNQGEIQAGPTLHEVCGRSFGDTEFEGYSPALRSEGGEWSEDTLAAFIIAPQSVVPGTNMAWEGTENTEAARAVAGALCAGADTQG